MVDLITTAKCMIAVSGGPTSEVHYVKQHEDSGWFLEKGIHGDIVRDDSEVSEVMDWIIDHKAKISASLKVPDSLQIEVLPIFLQTGIRTSTI